MCLKRSFGILKDLCKAFKVFFGCGVCSLFWLQFSLEGFETFFQLRKTCPQWVKELPFFLDEL